MRRNNTPRRYPSSLKAILFIILSSALLMLPAGPRLSAQSMDESIEEVAGRAAAFLESLTPSQREAVGLAFEDRRRTDWHYIPRSRPGLPLKDMSKSQRRLAWHMVRDVLSETGFDKVQDVLLLEAILGEMTGRRSYRDPENYAVVFFGDPAGKRPWAWRFEGHHLSLNFTLSPDAGGRVAFTPAFYGTNPAVVPEGHEHAGLRALELEHDIAFELIGMFDDVQLETVLIGTRSPGDIVTGPGREHRLRKREGLPLNDMSRAQRDRALKLIEVYVNNVGEEFARDQLERIRSAGLENLNFAWAGSRTPGAPHYYRLHGPTLIVEYDNTQGGANHVHSVLHDPTNSFGEDLLQEHYAAHHR
jgi:hypothetical protein